MRLYLKKAAETLFYIISNVYAFNVRRFRLTNQKKK